MDVFFSPVPRLEHSITRKSARFRARYYICIKEYEVKKEKNIHVLENEVVPVDNARKKVTRATVTITSICKEKRDRRLRR